MDETAHHFGTGQTDGSAGRITRVAGYRAEIGVRDPGRRQQGEITRSPQVHRARIGERRHDGGQGPGHGDRDGGR